MRLLAFALVAAACSTGAEPRQLSVYGPYVGAEADIFGEVLEAFEEETGITTRYVGSNSFQSSFADRLATADLPDVVVLPQPALLSGLIESGVVSALDSEAGRKVTAAVGEQWAAIVSHGDRVFAVPYRFVVKSLVWHRSDIFEERDYAIPQTLDELDALSQRMIEDGLTPWCAGMDDARATGWWATDWVEDLVMRRAGAEIYGSWADLGTPFSDDRVIGAMREFQELVGSEESVNGGRSAVLNRSVEDAIDPMFENQPACLMHKQASFQPVWLPDGVGFDDPRLDVFPLPGITADAAPLLVSGEIVAATSETAAARTFLMYLLEDAAFEPWHDVGGSLVARASLTDEVGDDPFDRRLGELIDATDRIFFDASDLMPEDIGTGAFFEGMIDLVAGVTPEEVAQELDLIVREVGDG